MAEELDQTQTEDHPNPENQVSADPENALAAPAEPAAPDPAAPEPPKTQEMPKWGWDRLHEESNGRKAEREARLAAERKAADAQALLDRIQKGPAPAAEVPVQRQEPNADNYQQAVRAEAARIRLFEDTLAVRNAGLAEYPDFQASLDKLNALGALDNDFVADILATTDRASAHKLIDRLAKDGEKTSSLVRMDSRARIAQLTRMSMTENQPKPQEARPQAAPSRAPRPQPAIDPAGPSGDPTDLLDDNITDDEWFRRYKSKNKVA